MTPDTGPMPDAQPDIAILKDGIFPWKPVKKVKSLFPEK